MSKSASTWSGLILLWAAAAAAGFLVLGAYHARPGDGGTPPDRWPSGTPIPLDPSLPTLLIFVDPRCPCSPASLAELEETSARCRGLYSQWVVAFQPEAATGGREGSGPGAVKDLAGASSWVDPGGCEARRFGVETSGHVLLFDPSGLRRFSGGITISRGHRGANPGLERLIAAIRGAAGAQGSGPVFGCPMLEPGGGRTGGRP